jgi:hypothetical protein
MSQPNVSITELDGNLGSASGSADKLFALVGPADAGPLNTPTTWGRPKDVLGTFVGGPLVEAGCHYLDRYKKPIVLVRSTSSTAGDKGTINVGGVAGSSVVTATGNPNDDYEARFRVVNGGTIGNAGITYQYSLDGGRNWSGVLALGTANTFAFPGAGTLGLAFAAGTLLSGDEVFTRAVAPVTTSADLATALNALAQSLVAWDLVKAVSPIDANAFDVLDLKLAAMAAGGKYRGWIGNARMPNVGESESTYLTTLSGIFGNKASLYGDLCAGACKLVSSVSGRKYRRPASFVIAAREASLEEHIDSADVNLGPLTGVDIRDANGNPDEHDESINPGLDDARFTVLRTWEGLQGVYVNRPRLFSPAGSDFQLLPHRRVMNLGHAALRLYFMRRLNKPILVSKLSGFILESEAQEIEAGARAVLRDALMAKPKASGVDFTLSRTDNLLASKTLNGDARIIPLAYPEFINLSVGFYNPALQVQAV